MYYIISSSIWIGLVFTLCICLFSVWNKSLDFNGMTPTVKDIDCITKYDIWNTWADSGVIFSGLGGYFGLLHQHKKYGGQLFIQKNIETENHGEKKRYILRLLVLIFLGTPLIVMTVLIAYLATSIRKDQVCSPQSEQT